MKTGFDSATILATTLESIKKEVIDNVSEKTALFFWLNDKGRIDEEDGGYQIREPLMYGLNETIKSYAPGDHYSTQRPGGFTSVYYEWSHVGGTIVLDGPTEFMNQGKNAIVRLVEGYAEQLEVSWAIALSDMFYSDGTGNNSKDILGLDLLVEDGDPAWNTVGGINSNTSTYWRNYFDNDGQAFGTDGNCNGLSSIRTMVRITSKLGQRVDLLLTSGTQYDLMEGALAKTHVWNMPDTADKKYVDAGFGGLKYKGTLVVWDEKFPNTTDWLALNSKALRFVVGTGHKFELEGPLPHPTMDAKILKSKLYAQLTVRGRRDSLGRLRLNGS